MGFFKDFKQDLTQAVNELTEDTVKSVSTVDDESADDVMVDTLSENEDEVKEELDVNEMLKTLDEESFEDIPDLPEEAFISEPNEEPESAAAVEEVLESPDDNAGDTKDDVMKETVEEVDLSELIKEKVSEPVTDDEETTIISRGLKINGDVESSGSIELLGTVEGNVSCSGKLIACGRIVGNTKSRDFFADKAEVTGDINCEGTVKIGNGSVIIGNLHAGSAVIAGAIKGDIDVHGPVIVDSTAIVMGDIKSESFQINGGAVLEGYISQCYSDRSPKKFFGDK